MAQTLTAIHARTLGECWLRTSAAILEHGGDAAYDGMPIKEIARMTLSVAEPDPDDPTIAELGDPAWSAWMHENFFTPVAVPGARRRAELRVAALRLRRQPAGISSPGRSTASAATRRRARRRSRRSSR